eukprot:XP_003728105.1 PREDICTED: lysocardiolipin acyltransferase 1-like [Strongylocentrotus purpuratus]
MMGHSKVKGFGTLFLSFYSAFVVSVILMGPMLPLMILAPQIYRRATDRCIGMWMMLPVSLLEVFYGCNFKTIGDKLVPNERSLLILNHRTRIDWLFFIACMMRQTNSSDLKIILKSQLKNAPCIGWSMQVACFIFLSRQWAKDRIWMTTVLKYFSELRYNFQLLLFPEGINFCRTGREISDAYATKNDLPKYKYVLHPHTTGFSFTLDYLKQMKKIDTVYDVTVAYCDVIPEKGEIDFFRGNVPQEMEFLIHKYPVSALPNNKEDLDNWCVEKWKEKEARLEKFYTGAKTFEGQEDGKLENLSTQCLPKVYFVITFWVTLFFGTLYAMFVSSFFFWSVAFIITAYVVMGKYFGGADNLAISSFNFTQDITHKARAT